MSSTGPGMSIHGSVETSCKISASGNSGARSCGPTGSFVPGCSGGSGAIPACAMSGKRFSHAVGSWSGSRLNCTRSVISASLRGSRCDSLPSRSSRQNAGYSLPVMQVAVDPDVEPIAFLLGTWRGEGEGTWPEAEPFRYTEELVFEHFG